MADGDPDQKKLCFVIGPIGDPGTDIRRHADWLLHGIIKPVFDGHFPDFIVQRADEIVVPGNISSQVISRLISAPLVIADMSLHNANAFYELAIRHMKMLPTVHLIHENWKIPFDVAPYRAIPFVFDNYSDLEKAQKELQSTVTEAIAPDFRVENPVTYAIGRVELELQATPEMKVILERLDKIEAVQATAVAERDAAIRALFTPVPKIPYAQQIVQNEVLLNALGSAASAGTGIISTSGVVGKGSSTPTGVANRPFPKVDE